MIILFILFLLYDECILNPLQEVYFQVINLMISNSRDLSILGILIRKIIFHLDGYNPTNEY